MKTRRPYTSSRTRHASSVNSSTTIGSLVVKSRRISFDDKFIDRISLNVLVYRKQFDVCASFEVDGSEVDGARTCRCAEVGGVEHIGVGDLGGDTDVHSVVIDTAHRELRCERAFAVVVAAHGEAFLLFFDFAAEAVR